MAAATPRMASVEPISQGARPYLRYERVGASAAVSTYAATEPRLWADDGALGPSNLRQQKCTLRAARGPATHRDNQAGAHQCTGGGSARDGAAEGASGADAARPMERVSSARRKTPLTRWWQFRDVHWALGLKFWALISGGGALSGQLEQFWNALGFVVVQGYGMTETTAMITLNHPFHVAKGTIGKPLPGREVKLGSDGEVLVRGPMISNTTWSRGQLQYSGDEWLATGDLAQQQATGELTFLGRKSEVIVTAAGVNLHPEDLEAALEQEPEIRGCAVVPLETANGTEAFAVLALRGPGSEAASVVERANRRLAEFQRLRRWAIWPEPDLPRTSTGKVRRKAVAEWAAATALKDAAGDSAWH